METCCVHHVEFGVKNGNAMQEKFIQQYRFYLAATRKTSDFHQWVLKSGTATVVVTEQTVPDSKLTNDQYVVGWKFGRNEQTTDLDSVYNIALKVKDLQSCMERLKKCNIEILRPVRTVQDAGGEVTFAVVRSCVGNVVHTLLQENDYRGSFLPEFEPVASQIPVENDNVLVTHFDHVTFSCPCGDSASILDWYSECFGMQRFFINRNENEEEGFVIDSEDIGLRLKVFEYWRCAETGLTTSTRPGSIKFVIGEPLLGQGPNQIDTFLNEHGGPGVQHIGLHTNDIISTVDTLDKNGVKFAEPPYTYYTEIGKLKEIREIGENVDVLQKNGILVDAEADPDPTAQDSLTHKYLMQKFTKPVFNKNTFFLEIIQRIGARGFGSGNITALWRSVQAYMNEGKSS